jgi:hypothetical protein
MGLAGIELTQDISSRSVFSFGRSKETLCFQNGMAFFTILVTLCLPKEDPSAWNDLSSLLWPAASDSGSAHQLTDADIGSALSQATVLGSDPIELSNVV